MVPDRSLSIRAGAIAAWPGAWHGKNLRDILEALGHDIDRPWSALSQNERDWILFTEEQPVVTVHPVRDASTVQGLQRDLSRTSLPWSAPSVAALHLANLQRNNLRDLDVDIPMGALARGPELARRRRHNRRTRRESAAQPAS